MENALYYNNLNVPSGKIDVVLDTDAYNEVDDQYAIAYMLGHSEKLNVKGICAAPFLNPKAESVKDGMEKSFNEILKVLTLAGYDNYKPFVYKGSQSYLPDVNTPVQSEAADFMSQLSEDYSPENPLYIVAIGAITNVASAILKNPNMKENCVVIWLGGHSANIPKAAVEFNMKQDIAAARVVFGCGVPLVQLPCRGVVDRFLTTQHELSYWLKGKNQLCDYLYENTVQYAEAYARGKPWSRVIWDVTAVAWLLNDNDKFMQDTLVSSPIPEYDKQYAFDNTRHLIKSVYWINRDALFEDLFNTLGDMK
ncbi:MAG: nucleoside hydrolase [Clostridia bacterium]|nr:nucleoside hydrolase [Clostridia bacterium]